MKLVAKTPEQRAVLEFLEENASDELKAKIDAEGKTLAGCWAYITSVAKARIPMKDRHGERCVHLTAEEVFGSAIHYFEDEEEGALYRSDEEIKADEERKRNAEKRGAAQSAKFHTAPPPLPEKPKGPEQMTFNF